jgi:hypothetical protein
MQARSDFKGYLLFRRESDDFVGILVVFFFFFFVFSFLFLAFPFRKVVKFDVVCCCCFSSRVVVLSLSLIAVGFPFFMMLSLF